MLSRRAVLLAALSAASLACRRKDPRPSRPWSGPLPEASEPDPPALGSVRVLEWELGGPSSRAAIVVPAWGDPDARYPVLIALHGRGEALKPPAEGALGWPRDYALTRAMTRLANPPLTEADYEGFVAPEQLAQANARLASQPFRGIIVACPYLPDLGARNAAEARAYGEFLIEALLPRVRRETPALTGPESTGIDGVSLGGVTALRIGLANPRVFGAVGGIQPAVAEDDVPAWVDLAKAARAQRPSMALRILTSHDDYFRRAITRLSRAWEAAGIAHDFADVPGPHDYAFNRGPGSIELLSWHDRALARR